MSKPKTVPWYRRPEHRWLHEPSFLFDELWSPQPDVETYDKIMAGFVDAGRRPCSDLGLMRAVRRLTQQRERSRANAGDRADDRHP